MARYSMFIQPFGYDPDTIRPMLEHLRYARESSDHPDTIDDICIEHVGTKDGQVDWPVLDTIMEYAPGGPRRACGNMFVGSGNARYSGPGSKYREGVMSDSYRAAHREHSADLAGVFFDRFGDSHYFHFYCGFEAVANWWTDPDVRAGYADLLTDQVRIFHQLAPNRAVLYSPAYWQLDPPSGIAMAIDQLFTEVKHRAAGFGNTRGVDWISFQDMYGRKDAWLDPQTANTAAWYRAFRAHRFASVRVTAEAFETVDFSLVPCDALAFKRRLDSYEGSWGLRLGPVFELRYWFEIERALGRVVAEPDVPTTPPVPPASKPFQVVRSYREDDMSPQAWGILESLAPGPDLVEATIVGLHEDDA